MAFNEEPGTYQLQVDRGDAVAVSTDADTRRALHVKVKNLTSEPIPISVAGDGLATEAKQDVGNASLSDIDSKLTTTNADLSQIDSDLNAFKAANHTDLATVDTDLNAFKSANHADMVTVQGKQDTGNASLSSIDGKLSNTLLGTKVDVQHSALPDGAATAANQSSQLTELNQIDTDLVAFKTANHSDFTALQTSNHTDLTQLDTDLKASQPRKMQDGAGTALTSTLVGLHQSLDVNVSQSVLPAGAATSAKQDTLDTDLNAFKTANHTDLTQVDSDLNLFKAANHTDLTQVDTDLVAFKTANHTDLTTNQPRKMQDGSGNALTSTAVNGGQALDIHQKDTSFIVSGLTAVGSTPSLNPVSVSGVDGGGLKRAILTDTAGRTEIQQPDPSKLSVNTSFSYYCEQGKVFGAPTPLVNIGTTETPFLLLRNPLGSPVTVKLFKTKVGGGGYFRIYTGATVTANGTTITPVNFKVGGAAANALVTYSPTVSANGNFLSIEQATAQSGTTPFDTEAEIVIPANSNILITALMGANNTPTHAAIEWVEL